jgi:CPA2 family monovalent cation:H+ antiporter-2
MPHATPLITTIVAGIGLAFIFGAIANRLRISPLVGYLVAGVIVGPATPGFVADAALAHELAEIGVILLMFGVGLHFSMKDLMKVKSIAVPGAAGQIAFATLLGMGLAWTMGWSVGAGLVFGLALSVASTVVLLRALQERRLIETQRGRIAVGWLIVEDLAMVLALVLLPAVASLLEPGDSTGRELTTGDIAITLAITLGKVAAFVAFMLVVGRRVIPWALHYMAHTGSRELFRLSVLAIALGVAYLAAQLFGVSFALGAFFAGMILSESQLSHRAAEETLPLRDAFAVLFFVSVGMLFDPRIVLEHPLPLLGTVFIILVGKTVAAFLIVRAFGHDKSVALTISASLAQIGEFSFILAGLGVGLGMLPPEGQDLILAGAILSIFANPFVFSLLDRWERKKEKATGAVPTPREEKLVPTNQTDHAVIVGFGRVGGLIGEAFRERGKPFLVIEDDSGRVEQLRAQGIETIRGNAAAADVLSAANLAGARWLFVAIPQSFEAGQTVSQARAVNPSLDIIARAHSEAEMTYLAGHGATTVVMAERETARAMLELATGIKAPGQRLDPGLRE